MKRLKNGSTGKQYAYALRRWSGEDKSRRQLAKEVGYSQAVADNVVTKVEKTDGFKNALGEIARMNNAVMLKVYAELAGRDISKEDFKKLIDSIDVLSKSFERFLPKEEAEKALPYKALLLQHVENQTIQAKQPEQKNVSE